MSMIFKFTTLSNEVDDFLREYEVPYDMDMLALHGFLCRDLGYDDTAFCSFFKSNAKWEKEQEYTLADMQDDEGEVEALPMEGTLLGQIIHERHDRLIFMFDLLSDRSLFMELTDTHAGQSGAAYPRVAASAGDAPDQYDSDNALFEESPFDDIMDDFSDFESYEEESLSDEF